MGIVQVTLFIGWCLGINLAILSLSVVILICCKASILRMHSRLFDIEEADLNRMYLGYLAHYKILILVFNLVPYLVLRLMLDS